MNGRRAVSVCLTHCHHHRRHHRHHHHHYYHYSVQCLGPAVPAVAGVTDNAVAFAMKRTAHLWLGAARTLTTWLERPLRTLKTRENSLTAGTPPLRQ